METLKCHLWSARRAQPLAELSQAERSEAQPREARPPPKAAGAVRRPGAEGDPRASRGLQTKARMRLYWLRLSSWRLNSLGRRESVLCTNGICVMAQKHIFQHCASARDFYAQMGDLESGEVMSRPNFMISENGPGSIQMHCKCIIITPHGP